jgi:hypothetical protein
MTWTKQEELTYHTWYDMMDRCYTPHHKEYKRYGGEGITVCEKWHNFRAFLAEMGLKPDGLTLERKDNDGPYELANCVWATPAEQARNRRSNVMLTHNGRTLCVADWARELGVPRETIYKRIRLGFPTEQVLFQGDLRPKS